MMARMPLLGNGLFEHRNQSIGCPDLWAQLAFAHQRNIVLRVALPCLS
jgi:hypothetical protein